MEFHGIPVHPRIIPHALKQVAAGCEGAQCGVGQKHIAGGSQREMLQGPGPLGSLPRNPEVMCLD